jgi:murein DD-endopeptidase MepM/ murein hydrolase activator NlpD
MSHWRNARPKRFAVVHRPLRPVRIQLHPFMAGGLLLLALALLGWSGATTTYALFRDEFLMQIVTRHTAAERASSAEIARLKADVEQNRSRLLVEREGFAEKLIALARRQDNVERRQQILSGVSAKMPVPSEGLNGGELRLGVPQEPLRESRADTERPTLSAISARYDAIEHRQKETMAGLQTRLDRDRQNLAHVYSSIGLKPEPVKAGLGGLYIPFKFGAADATTRDLQQIEESAAETERLRSGLDQVPVRNPAPGAREASGFGNRIDPFLGTMAFHSGLDLEMPYGASARATAAGTVVSAGWNGGYGLMVEVRHAHGFSTRYAHLSSIAVSEGQEIKTGDLLGRVGTTGRSTGAHLHYETRMGDTPLDPRRFLAAGAVLED